MSKVDMKDLRAELGAEWDRHEGLPTWAYDYFNGLLDRLEAAEAEPLPSPLPEDHLARGMGLAMAIGKQDGRKFALRTEVEELAKALGLSR